MIAPGQDECDYSNSQSPIDLDVIVYEPSSGVTWSTLQSVLSGTGTVVPVSGVGDKAMFAGVELDFATGKYFVALQGAGGQATSVAVAKQLVGALASK